MFNKRNGYAQKGVAMVGTLLSAGAMSLGASAAVSYLATPESAFCDGTCVNSKDVTCYVSGFDPQPNAYYCAQGPSCS